MKYQLMTLIIQFHLQEHSLLGCSFCRKMFFDRCQIHLYYEYMGAMAFVHIANGCPVILKKKNPQNLLLTISSLLGILGALCSA